MLLTDLGLKETSSEHRPFAPEHEHETGVAVRAFGGQYFSTFREEIILTVYFRPSDFDPNTLNSIRLPWIPRRDLELSFTFTFTNGPAGPLARLRLARIHFAPILVCNRRPLTYFTSTFTTLRWKSISSSLVALSSREFRVSLGRTRLSFKVRRTAHTDSNISNCVSVVESDSDSVDVAGSATPWLVPSPPSAQIWHRITTWLKLGRRRLTCYFWPTGSTILILDIAGFLFFFKVVHLSHSWIHNRDRESIIDAHTESRILTALFSPSPHNS